MDPSVESIASVRRTVNEERKERWILFSSFLLFSVRMVEWRGSEDGQIGSYTWSTLQVGWPNSLPTSAELRSSQMRHPPLYSLPLHHLQRLVASLPPPLTSHVVRDSITRAPLPSPSPCNEAKLSNNTSFSHFLPTIVPRVRWIIRKHPLVSIYSHSKSLVRG